jgi:hypothetical protein
VARSATFVYLGTVNDLEQKPLLGHLGQPLGKIITIAGVVRQGELGAKASPRDVLSVETVNDRPLAQARNYRI